MILRWSEMEAKKKDTKRRSDPLSDIEDASERTEKEEVEERREMDQVDISQRDSVGTKPKAAKVKRP